ncbi:hypothetical protein scyTo_0023853, partial [Scyliorhinus torazame]|nr:hypothetical protein [Scyliorhinus torazame]
MEFDSLDTILTETPLLSLLKVKELNNSVAPIGGSIVGCDLGVLLVNIFDLAPGRLTGCLTDVSVICIAPPPRDRLARTGLGVILDLAKDRDDAQLARVVTGILQHMFKHTEETSYLLITNGGLDSILYWCRSKDSTILRHCAIALANCAMHGGNANQRLMIEKKAADWLFPLAFSKDQLVRFHACLAITVLATNKEIEKEVVRSGTLELVEPFIASLHPEEFARNWLESTDNSQGRTAYDLQRLVQLLDSSTIEAQCMAAFYLCVEAGIKLKQRKTQILHEIGATQSLKRLVSYSGNVTISNLAKKALHLMGEKVPRRLSAT